MSYSAKPATTPNTYRPKVRPTSPPPFKTPATWWLLPAATGRFAASRSPWLPWARAFPLALAPLGTANNIARTLGLTDSTETLLRGLADPQPRPFDLGLIRAPWGEAKFLEAFGVGLFAEGLKQYSPDERKSLVRMAHAAIETLTQAEAREWQCDLDGRDLSGRYLMLEVMNTQAMGLRLRLAPDANPSDGLFDVVRVSEDDAVGFGAYLTKLVEGDLETLPNVEIVRGKQLKPALERPTAALRRRGARRRPGARTRRRARADHAGRRADLMASRTICSHLNVRCLLLRRFRRIKYRRKNVTAKMSP